MLISVDKPPRCRSKHRTIKPIKTLSLYLTVLIVAFCFINNQKSEGSEFVPYSSELKISADKRTGVQIKQLTNYKGNSHHLYFTNSGWFDNGNKLLFSSDRGNETNLFAVDLHSYRIQQVSDLGSASVAFFSTCINPAKEEAYFWNENTLFSLDLNTLQVSTLIELEPGWVNSMASCSADGKYVYFSIHEDLSHLFEVDVLIGYVGFDETWSAKPHSKILRVATDGSKKEVLFEEKYWIGHVNASPTQSELITFCHEGPWMKVDNRIWGFNADTKTTWKIRPKTHEGERVGHEYWYADGETIGFHGTRADGTAFLGHTRFDNTQLVEVDFLKRTGHIYSNDENLIVGDGGGVLRLWKWNGNSYDGPRILCEHKSSLKTQHSHPHPRFNASGNQVLFTSDRSGYCNVYQIDIPEFESLPLWNEKK